MLVGLSKRLRLRSLIGEMVGLRTIVSEMNVRGECCLLFGPSILLFFRELVKFLSGKKKMKKEGLRTARADPKLGTQKTPHCYIIPRNNVKKLISRKFFRIERIKNQHISTEFISIICLFFGVFHELPEMPLKGGKTMKQDPRRNQ